MAIKYTLGRGGYVHDNGGIQVAGYDSETDVGHSEHGTCDQKHSHSKQCAEDILDLKPVLGKDVKGEPILGLSMRERHEAWFAAYEAAPEDPKPVELPKKTMLVANEKGNMVSREVDDVELS